MTPQYILRKSLCRPAHCFSARVQGKGYVNDGSANFDQAEYIRQRTARAEAEIENMNWSAEYAESGYGAPEKGILFADWNVFPRGVDTILERAGYDLQWSDEWGTCEDCGKAVRTQPDSWGWKPYYAEAEIENGTFVCLDCYVPPSDDTDTDDTDTDTDDQTDDNTDNQEIS